MTRSQHIPTAAQLDAFAGAISGRVSHQQSSDYEAVHREQVWNGRPPEWRPLLIVEAHSTADVVCSVVFARRHDLTVSVRGTGHSYSAVFLSHCDLLLNLSCLSDIVVDRQARQLSVGPGARSGQISAALAQEGMAFPVGHDADVGIAGFLLGGGLGINFAACGGMSAFSILAAEIVNADGETQRVSATENPDLFWALRGGGPGLPFIVTRFHLRCFDYPGAIVNSSWLFCFSELPHLAQNLDAVASSLDQRLQVMIALIPAPLELAAQCSKEEGGRLVALSVTAFAKNNEDAAALLATLPDFPNALLCAANQTTTLADIQQQGKTLLVSRRYRADNILCNDLGGAVDIVMRHLPESPSPTSLSLIVWLGQRAQPDAAYSATGRYSVSTYAQWNHIKDDQPNADWLKRFYDEMKKVATGAYINEFDLEGRLDEACRCYSPATFERLCRLRKTYDPSGVFYDPYSSFPS